MEPIFEGSAVALVLPMLDDGSIDYDGFKRQVQRMIDGGVQAILVNGTTGETPTIHIDEEFELTKIVMEMTKGTGIKVIAGAGSNDTETALKKAKFAKEVGADAILVVTPYYNKTTQAGLISHYTAITKETNLPIILYSVPSRTGVNITPQTCLELSKIPNIVAIKEASGNLSQIAEIANLCRENLNIYSGNDDQITPILSVGGIGVISVLSNIAPKYTHQITEEFFKGNVKEACKLQIDAIPLIKALFCEVNPIPVKEACNMLGFGGGNPRLPLITLSEKGKDTLKKELISFGLLK